MENTTNYDLAIVTKENRIENENYVLIQAGKGKKKDSTIYVKVPTFSIIEGMIWNKFREYRITKKTKISSNEFVRVLEEFEENAQLVPTAKDAATLSKLLLLDTFGIEDDISNLLPYTNQIASFLVEFSKWLSSQMKREKHIYIIKDYLQD